MKRNLFTSCGFICILLILFFATILLFKIFNKKESFRGHKRRRVLSASDRRKRHVSRCNRAKKKGKVVGKNCDNDIIKNRYNMNKKIEGCCKKAAAAHERNDEDRGYGGISWNYRGTTCKRLIRGGSKTWEKKCRKFIIDKIR